MHVGCREGDVPHRRRLEGAGVFRVFRDRDPAEIGLLRLHADADVVKFLVGEIRTDVAGGAVALFGKEDVAAALGILRHRVGLHGGLDLRIPLGQVGVVGDVFGIEPGERLHLLVVVVGRGSRDDRPLEGGDGLADAVDCELTEDLLELLLVDRQLPEPLDDALVREAHLDRILNRPDGLGFERIGAAIPKLWAGKDAVERHRRVAAAKLVTNSHARLRLGRVSHRRIVAARAAHGRVGREPLVEVELAAEFNLGPRERVFVEAGDLRRSLGEAERQDRIELDEVLGIGEPGVDLGERDRARSRHAGGETRFAEHHLFASCRSGWLDRPPGIGDRPIGLRLGVVGLAGGCGCIGDHSSSRGLGAAARWRELDGLHLDDLLARRRRGGGTSGERQQESEHDRAGGRGWKQRAANDRDECRHDGFLPEQPNDHRRRVRRTPDILDGFTAVASG